MEQDEDEEPPSFGMMQLREKDAYPPQSYTERLLIHAYAITPPPEGIYIPNKAKEEEYREKGRYCSQEYQEEEEGEYRYVYGPLSLSSYNKELTLKALESLLGDERNKKEEIRKIWKKLRKIKNTKSKKNKKHKKNKKEKNKKAAGR